MWDRFNKNQDHMDITEMRIRVRIATARSTADDYVPVSPVLLPHSIPVFLRFSVFQYPAGCTSGKGIILALVLGVAPVQGHNHPSNVPSPISQFTSVALEGSRSNIQTKHKVATYPLLSQGLRSGEESLCHLFNHHPSRVKTHCSCGCGQPAKVEEG